MRSLPGGAVAWLEELLPTLPSDLRPDPEDLVPFGHLFASWLETSFELVLDPGLKRVSPQNHCFCPMCSWLVAAPTLRTKKLRARDRRRAEALKEAWIRALAATLPEVPEATILAVAADPELREACALGAYGVVLQDRMAGRPLGPEVLALWRSVAWTREGSPRKGFTLSAGAILGAEATVRDRLGCSPQTAT